jgi:DNA-binding FrmR family transcriptional regulator
MARAPKVFGRKEIADRLNRVAGQVQGVARMLAEDRYCIDVLTQLQAIKAAVGKVEDMVLLDHSRHCLNDALKSSNPDAKREKLEELVALYGKFKK